jgi:DNA-directed RNA polymerase specialized sigma subunit
MKIQIYIIIFLHSIPFVFLYLTKINWLHINKFIINKHKYSQQQINQINQIIYSHYQTWAFYKSYQFKNLHFYKCKEIKQNELNLYASIGLQKAIRNYNPNKNTTFSNYAIKYIIGELYNGITIMQPLNALTKNERKKSFNKRITNDHHKIILASDNNFMFDNILQPYDSNLHKKYEQIWENIFLMDISQSTKKIVQLKYDFDFTKLRSNKDISIILDCSEENVRQHINKFKILYAAKME